MEVKSYPMTDTVFTYKGYVGKILRVNLTEGTWNDVALTNEMVEHYIGGAGIAARILYDELAPGIDPLSPENKAIFMTGPVEGTMIPAASRRTCSSPFWPTACRSRSRLDYGRPPRVSPRAR